MPLIHSSSKPALRQNMHTLMGEIGKSPHVQSRKQAIAIALDTQRRAGHAFGGMPRPHFGLRTPHPRLGAMHTGPIMGHTMGRGDKVPMKVASGSYVLPADHVSHLGQGNTMAGFKVVDRMFPKSSSPYSGFAAGGAPAHNDGVEIMAADGEYVLHPSQIVQKFGSLKRGHEMLDNWIPHERRQHIDKLKKLPGPVKE